MAIQVRSTGPKVSFWGQNLKLLSPALFANVSRQTGDPLEGRVTIYTDRLDPDIREQLMESLVLMSKMPAPGSMEEHNAVEKATLDAAVRQAEAAAKWQALEDSGNAQLELYRKAGLADTERNSRLITEYIQKHARGIYCAVSVRAAVENERINLNWVKVELAKPVVTAPAPSTEVLGTLSDGSRQLSLSAPVPRNATVAQAKDYLARIRQQQQPDVVVVDGFKSAM